MLVDRRHAVGDSVGDLADGDGLPAVLGRDVEGSVEDVLTQLRFLLCPKLRPLLGMLSARNRDNLLLISNYVIYYLT